MKHLLILLFLFIGVMCCAQNDTRFKKIPIYQCNEKSLLDLIDTLITTEVRLGIINYQMKYDISISVYDFAAGCFFKILRDSTIFQFEDTLDCNTYGYFEYKGNRVLINLGRIPGDIMSLGCITPTDKYLSIKCVLPIFVDNKTDDTMIEMPHVVIWGNIDNGKVSNYIKREFI